MSLLARLFMILAVAVFAASPVMACCLNHPVEASAETHHTDTLPCHGETETAASEPVSHTDMSDCPGCADCATAMLQAEAADHSEALASVHDLQLTLIQGDQWTGFEAPRIVRTTGPPHGALVVPDTPITLKQRFLI